MKYISKALPIPICKTHGRGRKDHVELWTAGMVQPVVSSVDGDLGYQGYMRVHNEKVFDLRDG